jgi:hypothetical protein
MRSTNGLDWKIWAAMNGLPGVVAVIMLYLVPSFAVDTFAWPVPVRASALFLAASFLFRGAFFLLIFLGVSWNRLRYFTWGNIAFALVLLISTFLHADKFRFDIFTGWVWLYLYLEEPIWMVFLISRAARQPREPSAHPVPLMPAFKVFLFVQSLILIGVSGFLLFGPEVFDPQWPWTLTPLTGRVIAGWPLSFGVWSIVLANMDDWDDMKMGIGLNIFWLAALLVTTLVFFPEFNSNRLAFWLYLGFLVVALAGQSVLALLQQRRTSVRTV